MKQGCWAGGKPRVLCNAHYLRELAAAQEEGQKWPERMSDLLTETNKQAVEAGGKLPEAEQRRVRKKYRMILAEAEEENPISPRQGEHKRGRIPQTKVRNLLVRMRDYADEILRFMSDAEVPFMGRRKILLQDTRLFVNL